MRSDEPLLRMKREARRVAMRDCRSRVTPEASQTASAAIGRPQIASVSRNRRASGASAPSRIANMSAKVGGWPGRGMSMPA